MIHDRRRLNTARACQAKRVSGRGVSLLNPPRFCKAQATRRVGRRSFVEPRPATKHCTFTCTYTLFVTDFSQLLLEAAKLWFRWVVAFPMRKHSPRSETCVFPPPWKCDAYAAASLFSGLVRTGFGLKIVLVRKGASQGHTFAPKAATNAPGKAHRRPKGSQSLVLGVSGRTFWRQFSSLATLREPYYLPCFNDIRPAWGRQLQQCRSQCRPETLPKPLLVPPGGHRNFKVRPQ